MLENRAGAAEAGLGGNLEFGIDFRLKAEGLRV